MSTKYSLVTGAAGGIGTTLCHKLLSEGKHVIAIDNFCTGSKDNIIEHKNIRYHECDLVAMPAIDEPLSEIYHLACPTSVPNLKKLPLEMLSATSTGTKVALDLAEKNGAKFLLTSSSEVYGNPRAAPQNEDYTGNVDPIGMRSPYEEGKRFSEALVAAYVRYRGVHATIARIFNTFGPHFPKSDTRVVSHFVACALKGEPLPVQGEGKQIRTFLHVDDNIAALQLIMEKGAPGEAYNVGSDKQITIKALAELIIELTKSKSEITFVERPSHDHEARLPDLSKIHALGWSQTIDLEEAIKTATTG